MPRSVLAYLNDIITACDSVAATLEGIDIDAYASNRTVRAAVEREFTIIGEAVNGISRVDPEVAGRISHAGKIVGFRNLLVHDYPAIIDDAVWAIADRDAPILREECYVLLDELRRVDQPRLAARAWRARHASGYDFGGGVTMVPTVADKLDAIAALCRKYGVVRMYLFGSAIGSDFELGRSDVDLLVDFGAMDGYTKAHAYFDLLDELRDVLGTEVDLVMTGAVKNRYIAADIERTKQVLYAA
jgi:uncharacterized protein with HEPN domain/predicted nucleotidyltransferase